MSSTVEPVQSSKTRSLSAAVKTSCCKFEDGVRTHPNASMLISLGVGLGIGVVVGTILGGARQTPKHGWFDRHSAERIGSQFLDAISKVVPDSISHRSGS